MDKDYIVIVQCHIVKERCSGYLCEKAFHHREDAFAGYPADKPLRLLALTCGGCCGRAVHRKLSNLLHKIKQKEGVEPDRIAVHLSSCIVSDSYHGPACPHLAYLKELIGKLGLEIRLGSKISKLTEKRRAEGKYKPLDRTGGDLCGEGGEK